MKPSNLISTSISLDTSLYKKIQENGAVLLGLGEMGGKILNTFAWCTIPIIGQDINTKIAEETITDAKSTVNKAVKRKKLSEIQALLINQKNLIKDTVVFKNNGAIPFDELGKENIDKFLSDNLAQELFSKYKNSLLVLEAGPEILSFKQNMARFFELSLGKDMVFMTNTSSLKVSDIAEKMTNPENSIGFHYFLPAHINPLLEIIVHEKTSERALNLAKCLAIGMGKKPIICKKDEAGAIANRILVGVLNQAAKLLDRGIANSTLIDKIFLETFYEKQIKVQTKKAKRQFEAAPKLGFFKDETELYKEKKFEEAKGKLRQKILYANIVENLSVLGSFFKPADCIAIIKEKIKSQMSNLSPNIAPYIFPEPKSLKNIKNRKDIIKDYLLGAYIAISLEIYKEDMGSIHDVELACKEGFKWNIGPFELINKLGFKESKRLIRLANEELKGETGIAKEEDILILEKINLKDELSGIQKDIIEGKNGKVGIITIGRIHLQQLQQMQNSLGPEAIRRIRELIIEFENNSEIKSIIIKSQGGGPFSAGADLNYIEEIKWDNKKLVEYLNYGKETLDLIEKCPKPTVAIVDGAAVGGGFELALACDYRIVTDKAIFALPEVALGIIPAWGGTERLPKLAGKSLAKAIILTANLSNLGKKLSAEKAYKTGIADVFLLQSELPFYLSDLINGEITYPDVYIKERNLISVYTKPKRKEYYNKEVKDYSSDIVISLKLQSPLKPFKIKQKGFQKFSCTIAERLIDNAHDLTFRNSLDKNGTRDKILICGKKVNKFFIQPFVFIAQNRLLAPIFEKFGLL